MGDAKTGKGGETLLAKSVRFATRISIIPPPEPIPPEEPISPEVIPPPVITSGVARMREKITTYLSTLTVIYAVIYGLYINIESIMGLPPPAEKYCSHSTGGTCSRSDLFAFQMTSGLVLFICGIQGFYTWHVSQRAHRGLPTTTEGRLFFYLQESEELAAVHFAFHVWAFVISLTIPEHREVLRLTYHVLAGLVSWCGLEYQLLHHYGGKPYWIALFFGHLIHDGCICPLFIHTNYECDPPPFFHVLVFLKSSFWEWHNWAAVFSYWLKCPSTFLRNLELAWTYFLLVFVNPCLHWLLPFIESSCGAKSAIRCGPIATRSLTMVR